MHERKHENNEIVNAVEPRVVHEPRAEKPQREPSLQPERENDEGHEEPSAVGHLHWTGLALRPRPRVERERCVMWLPAKFATKSFRATHHEDVDQTEKQRQQVQRKECLKP